MPRAPELDREWSAWSARMYGAALVIASRLDRLENADEAQGPLTDDLLDGCRRLREIVRERPEGPVPTE